MFAKTWLSITLAWLLAGCSSSSSTFKEAEALTQQSKFEEAAAKFDLVCALDPKSVECPSADARAGSARVRAAEEAVKAGTYQKADRLYRLSLLSVDGGLANTVLGVLAADEMKQGVLFEKAASETDKLRVFEEMVAIAETKTPAAEKAKAWIAAERPGVLVLRVKAFCNAKPKGSCAVAWSELDDLAQKPAGHEEARAAYQAEQKRIEKSLLIAKRFLDVFKSQAKQAEAFKECFDKKAAGFAETEADPNAPSVAKGECNQEIYNSHAYERLASEQQSSDQFRRALATIADPKLVSLLTEAKESAASKGEYTKLELPKPVGGAK